MGFATIALTDHDTMAGVAEAAAMAASVGVEVIPACEISTLDDQERQVDLLAYGVSIDDTKFQFVLRSLRDGRFARAWGMVQRLNDEGHAVSFDRVLQIAGGPDNVGRPHIAKAMVEAQIVPDVASAFTPELILDGGRCYVQRVKISPAEAIVRIHQAGGVAVVAHPGRTGLTNGEIEEFATLGLDGIEAYYPRHDVEMTGRFLSLAKQLGLLVTGGSDDHGDINEGRLMGTIRLDHSHVAALHRAISSRRAVVSRS